MKKTIKIDKEHSLTLSNNVGWLFVYRDQFGRDIVPTIVPALNAGIDLIFAIWKETDGKFSKDMIKQIDTDAITSALWSASGIEAVDLMNIVWAMAKNEDESIPEPRTFFRSFETFPLDVVFPAAFELLYKGLISGKNLKRLQDALAGLKAEADSSSIK